MKPAPYSELSDLDLLSLCVWREARGEGILAKRGVAHVVLNRVAQPSWWGSSIQTVILHPFQFTSFNQGDQNSDKWPEEEDPSWTDSATLAENAMNGEEDITGGATSYYDISIPAPAWSLQLVFTVAIGRFRFFKEATDA